MSDSPLNDEGQLRWMAHEFTADLNLSEDKLQEFADLLKDIAGVLKLSPSELMFEVQKRLPEHRDDHDEIDWWKEHAA